MKKIARKIAIVLGVLVGIYVIGRATKALQYYTIPTSSSSPTIEVGDHILASNLVAPKRLDLVVFESPVSEGDYVKRLCGIPGDTVQIRNGILYVNGSNLDSGLVLKHRYFVDSKAVPKMRKLGIVDKTEVMSQGDIAQVNLCKNQIEPYMNAQLAPPTPLGEHTPVGFNPNWTANDFGPVVVPPEQLFFLGDNRDYSYDSRFMGFVPEESVLGVVIW